MVFFLFGVDMNVVVSKPEPDFLPGVMFKYNQDVNETAFEGGWGGEYAAFGFLGSCWAINFGLFDLRTKPAVVWK